jgi:hypothetical protein
MPTITIKNRAGQRQMVDAAVDAYLDWREDCTLLDAAYSGWTGSSKADRARTFDAYQRALEREESSANVYAEMIGKMADPLDIDLVRTLAA